MRMAISSISITLPRCSLAKQLYVGSDAIVRDVLANDGVKLSAGRVGTLRLAA